MSLLAPGTPAPAFTAQAHDGTLVRSSELFGSKDEPGPRVVLWFYPKADTPG